MIVPLQIQLRREDEEALARMVEDNLDDESMAPMDDIEGIRTIAPVTLQVQIKDFSPEVRSIAELGSRISREKSTTQVSILGGRKKKKVNQVVRFSEEVERWQEEDCDTSDEFPQPTVSSVVVAAKATTADQDRLRLEERRVPSPITSPQGKRHCAEIEMEMGAGNSAEEGVDLVDHVFGSLRRLYRAGEVVRDEVDEDGKPRTMHQAYYEIVSEKPMLDQNAALARMSVLSTTAEIFRPMMPHQIDQQGGAIVMGEDDGATVDRLVTLVEDQPWLDGPDEMSDTSWAQLPPHNMCISISGLASTSGSTVTTGESEERMEVTLDLEPEVVVELEEFNLQARERLHALEDEDGKMMHAKGGLANVKNLKTYFSFEEMQ